MPRGIGYGRKSRAAPRVAGKSRRTSTTLKSNARRNMTKAHLTRKGQRYPKRKR